MSKTRVGKIARLPREIRAQLNRRLANGEQGRRLVQWLNTLPEVQAVLAAEFEGRPINAQNFSDWKQGGYRDWVTQQEALELAQRLGEDAAELQADGRPPLTDTLALWLAARYAVATRQVAQPDAAEGWRRLRELCADVVELRRGDHCAERLRIERERWAAEQAAAKGEDLAAAQMWPIRKMLLATAFGDLYERKIKETGRVPSEMLDFLSAVTPEQAGAAGVNWEELQALLRFGIKVNQGESSPIKPEGEPCDCTQK